MQADSEIALERVQSEALGALLSIQSYRDIAPSYFDRFRAAVADAVTFFRAEQDVPAALLNELEHSAAVLRNEATAFPGRKTACEEMASWLTEQKRLLDKD